MQTALSQNHNPKNQLTHLPLHSQPTAPFQQIKIQEQLKQQQKQTTQIYFSELEIARIAQENNIIMAQLSSALYEKQIVLKLIRLAEKKEKSSTELENDKRIRRCAKDIQRKHKCLAEGCEKSYGTEGSLLQHIKLKHPTINSHDPPLTLNQT